MKRMIIIAAAAAAIGTGVSAQDATVTLDLTKATTPLSFDAGNGAWTGTYDDEQTVIESQVFRIVHNSMSDYNTWWGFTASNSADNTRQENTLTYQFSNMARGGIVLDENGKVKTDSHGAPVTSGDVPYLVAFANSMFAAHPAQVVFAGGKTYEAVGVYVNLNSYPYYSLECGDSFARAFTNGDRFTLTVHGVAADESEKSVEVLLASCDNGDLTINRGWKYVDLSELGEVNEIYFSLKSTDAGAYGDNTPSYFCLDKLMVKPVEGASVSAVGAESELSYDGARLTVTTGGAEFAAVYDVAGRMVMSSEAPEFSVASLPAGVYVVKAGAAKIKIAR